MAKKLKIISVKRDALLQKRGFVMAIETNNLSSIQAYQKSAQLEIANPNKQDKTALEQMTQANQANPAENLNMAAGKVDQMTIRNERQASLVAHLFGDGQSAIESSQKITYQAAIEKLNEKLKSDFGLETEASNPISKQALKAQGGMENWTPENTAKRIIEGSTAFLAGFQSAHPELEGEELMDRFMEVVGGGISQGFDEAKGILGNLKVLEGDIADNIDSTFSLVQEGLQNFRNQYLGITPEVAASPEDQAVENSKLES